MNLTDIDLESDSHADFRSYTVDNRIDNILTVSVDKTFSPMYFLFQKKKKKKEKNNIFFLFSFSSYNVFDCFF